MGIKAADECVYVIWKRIRGLRYVNPINQDQEKKKFFASPSYNPHFQYPPLKFDADYYKKKLRECKKHLDQSGIAHLINAKIDKLILWIELLENRGKEPYTKCGIAYYGKPSPELVETAKKILAKKIKDNEQYTLSAKEVAEFLRRQAKRWNIPWSIEIKKHLGARADNVTSEKTIYLKHGEQFSVEDAKRLAIHELGVHARRALMGEQQSYKIFLIGTAEYEATEEGLAAAVEEIKQVSTPKVLKSYAGRVLAVHLSLKHSFRAVYSHLVEYFAPQEAYQLTMRAKRGMLDTSQPGAFTKDYIYLKGMEEVKKIKDIKKLFSGRIGIEDMPKEYFD
ncbi:DUF1704 domain-containing protein [Candidatus Woesearchaeota archaeon]|nr:DUF1704 domain-containing protein [Candidatus Woesearchaeota archaeon]